MLRRGAALDHDDYNHIIVAHFTCQEWPEAEYDAREAIDRFGESESLSSLLAISLDMQGKTGDAIKTLEAALSSGHRRLSTLRNYLGLCLRLGRLESATETIQKLLSAIPSRDDRLELLRLQALIYSEQTFSEDALLIANEVGRLVNPEVESEEGMYLNLYMACTLHAKDISESVKSAFWQRVEKFTTTRPDSSLFRRITFEEDKLKTIDDFHNLLDQVVGDSRAQLNEYQLRERKAKSGELPTPFVLRPNFIFHYIGECFTLWEYSKKSHYSDSQFHLLVTTTNDAHPSKLVLRHTPLLDLPAILVLHELGLFDCLFAVFPRVAIPRKTVTYISQNAVGVFSYGLASRTAGALLKVVNTNLHRIDQPGVSEGKVTASIASRDIFDEFVRLAKSGHWAMYSDDAITRAWILKEKADLTYLSTVDFLGFAEEEGGISALQVVNSLGKLVSWNAGVTIAARYLIAALEGAVPEKSSLTASARLDRFQSHRPFTTLARAVWYPEKPAAQLISHAGTIVAGMLRHVQTDDRVLQHLGFLVHARSNDATSRRNGFEALVPLLFVALRSYQRRVTQSSCVFFSTVEAVFRRPRYPK